MKKVIHLPCCKQAPKSASAKSKEEYKKRLKMLCPSKRLRIAAKDIAAGHKSCEKCFYSGESKQDCRIPHTNAYMNALGIDPCYEGVLIYLSKEMERKQEETGATFDEIDGLLEDARSIIYDNLDTISALCGVIMEIESTKKFLPKKVLSNIYAIAEVTQDIIDNWDESSRAKGKFYFDYSNDEDYGEEDDDDYGYEYADEDDYDD
jgi:hypothetical protein